MQNHFILTPFFLDEPLPELIVLANPDWEINQPQLPKADQQTRMSTVHQPLAQKVCRVLEAGKRPVSIAGDCCTTIGVLAGLQKAGIDPTLIWFDAHGDFNAWKTSPSGFLGGMPLAMLVGSGEQTLCKAVNLSPLPENQVVLTDARDLDPGEAELLKNSDVHHLSSVNSLFDFLLPMNPLYIHFDTDVLTPDVAPAFLIYDMFFNTFPEQEEYAQCPCPPGIPIWIKTGKVSSCVWNC
jgi:arginase